MEGVDIVNIIQNYDYTWGVYGPAVIIATLGAFSILVGCIYFSEDGGMSMVSIAMGVILLFTGIYGCANAKEVPSDVHYQVIIDEDVNMKDFTKKYDIIEVQGEIYTVALKEEES
jgi:hypothetical protein